MNQACNLLRAVINKEQTVEFTADFFTNKYRGFQYDLSKLMDRVFYESSIEIKTILIELVCQMLRKSYEKNCCNRFVKSFAQRLRYFLQDLTKQLSLTNIGIIYRKEFPSALLEIFRLLNSQTFLATTTSGYYRSWQQFQLISKNKIKQDSNPELNTSKCSNGSQSAQKSYSKAFLLKFADVGSQPETKAIYETYVEFLRVSNESINLTKSWASEGGQQNSGQYDNDQTNMNGSKGTYLIDQDLYPGKQSSKYSRKEKLENIIEQCHSHILSIQEAMRTEMKIYQQNLVLERFESQRSIQ